MKFVAAATVVAIALTSSCQAANLVVKSTGGNVTFDIQYGIMHEDINNSGDGGIYAELIRNRAFQGSNMFPTGLSGWHSVNGAVLSIKDLSTPLSWALPSSLNIAAGSKKKGRVGFANDDFWGMVVRVQPYTGSFYVEGEYKGHFTASLHVADEWTQHKFVLTPTKDAPNTNNTFAITFNPCAVKGLSLDFNLISLFPPTYKNRKNGLRPDLVEDLAALNPKFLRLPGGNMLEGNIITEFWKWNETIGGLKSRPGMANVWYYEITYGLRLVEYMEWCDDLNIEPIVAVFAGLLSTVTIPRQDLQPYIDYAFNEIEFLTGTSPPNGARFAHPSDTPSHGGFATSRSVTSCSPYLQNNVVKEKVSTVVAGDNGVFKFTLPQLSIALLDTDAQKKRTVTLSA